MLTGYQSPGTRGRSIADGAREVKMFGEWVPIRAQIANLRMLSAHADADELIRWASTTAPRQVFVVHGEPQAAETLRSRLGREFGWPGTVPPAESACSAWRRSAKEIRRRSRLFQATDPGCTPRCALRHNDAHGRPRVVSAKNESSSPTRWSC